MLRKLIFGLVATGLVACGGGTSRLDSPANNVNPSPTPIVSPVPTSAPTPIPTPLPTVVPTPYVGDRLPVIRLKGDIELALEKNSVFADPGVESVLDEEDGDLLSMLEISGNVDTTTPGLYTRVYRVEDSRGQVVTATRNITVVTPANKGDQVTADLKVLTRVRGVSPETVYFSAMDSVSGNETTDLAGGQDRLAIAWSKLTYHFNFDDTDSGAYATTHRSRNHQLSGSPRAIHTFYCKGPEDPNWSDTENLCLFNVKVRVQDSVGDFDDASILVRIQTQDSYYAAADTICVSATSNWSGCPAGAAHMTDTPEQEAWSGKRVLYQRGSAQPYSNISVGLDAKNVTIDTYGQGSRPLIYKASIGDGLVSRNDVADALDRFTLDASGYVTAGWAYNITITGVRLGSLDGGHAVTLMTATDLDLDWSTTPNDEEFGRAYFASRSNWCSEDYDTPELDCSHVPYPYGVFITDAVIKGHPGSLPLINIGCFNGCAIVNSGMAGVEVKTANEHNSRIMGSWGLVVADSWFRGDHLGGPGGKNKLTIRVPGFGATAEALNPNLDPEDYASGGFKRGNNLGELYVPHYASVVNSFFNDAEQDSNSVATTFLALDKFHRYSLLYGNTIFSDPVTATEGSFSVLGLNGIHVYAKFNEIPATYAPCGSSSTEIAGYHNLSTIFVILEDWSSFDKATGSQCPRMDQPKVVPSFPL